MFSVLHLGNYLILYVSTAKVYLSHETIYFIKGIFINKIVLLWG